MMGRASNGSHYVIEENIRQYVRPETLEETLLRPYVDSSVPTEVVDNKKPSRFVFLRMMQEQWDNRHLWDEEKKEQLAKTLADVHTYCKKSGKLGKWGG